MTQCDQSSFSRVQPQHDPRVGGFPATSAQHENTGPSANKDCPLWRSACQSRRPYAQTRPCGYQNLLERRAEQPPNATVETPEAPRRLTMRRASLVETRASSRPSPSRGATLTLPAARRRPDRPRRQTSHPAGLPPSGRWPADTAARRPATFPRRTATGRPGCPQVPRRRRWSE